MMSLASKGGLICRKLLALGNFLGQQGQQHFVPILVTFWIALALRDQVPVMRNIGVVDEALHRRQLRIGQWIVLATLSGGAA